ncbi:SPOR domain-containing protein [Plebeiibacterium sediminum]|uniref:SPOR domain-containing protein n=1 Tax=Plebeiibacterium sediminum TaxID=2992112 RepID=A0AAE3M4M6_9BACT|nr:SPOR domain-containing protein [Plebeiobacterium sediminum]MCW3787034.1 SPOR domain-containing protein [Plebeiobacterium sediminum]
MKSTYIIFLAVFTLIFSSISAQNKVDKLGPLRTSKKIVSVFELSDKPDYAIQIIALKYPAGEPGFFNNVQEAREFDCADGYMKYCVGSYETHKSAENELIYYRDLGYTQAFIVNTSKYTLKSNNNYSGNTKFKPDPNKTYTIQLSAFRFPVYLSHFKGIEQDDIMEFYLKDKIYRYTTGKYKYEEAVAELGKIKDKGFKNAYVTELDAYLPYQIE